MNDYIQTLKEIVDDELITPSERYQQLIKYINQIYYDTYFINDNSKEENK